MARGWALILGASSGFGAASAVKLASTGLDLFGVHLDRKSTLPNAEAIISKIKDMGREAIFFNQNAADEEKRKVILDEIEAKILASPDSSIRVFIHSLAFGTLRPFLSSAPDVLRGAENHRPNDSITKPQMEMTIDVMANSLVYWTQDLVARGFLKKGARIFAITSAGGQKVWPSYGAVSAAKAAIESHIRQLALELAPMGVTANSIRAGVTDTPALRKIPGHEKMIEEASKRNPSGRLTSPDDVAGAIALLTDPGADWITGNVIGVDGGEFIVD